VCEGSSSHDAPFFAGWCYIQGPATSPNWTQVEGRSAADDAVGMARFEEVLGTVQTGRAGFGAQRRWWSKENNAGRRRLVVDVVRRDVERRRCATAVQQSVQGAWTTWEAVQQRSLSWRQIWEMPESALRFLLQATYDVLPTLVNLKRWKIADSAECPVCKRAPGNLEHCLSSCPQLLLKYTFRHNKVLFQLAEIIRDTLARRLVSRATSRREVTFIPAGASVNKRTVARETRRKWRSAADDWVLAVDGDGARGGTVPAEVVSTRLRPDITIYSKSARTLFLVELTVPWETRVAEAHERKLAKYAELVADTRLRGFKCELETVEVGCRGFLGWSACRFVDGLGLRGTEKKCALRRLQEVAVSASS